jgi:glycosyltransferase involved in cell wall biosynthesis
MKVNKLPRVCHVTSAHKDGDVRIFHKACVSLAKAGFETYCVVTNTEHREEQGVHIRGVHSRKGSRIKRFIFTVRKVYREAIAVKADIYHLHDPELLMIAKKLKRKTGAKVIFDSHEDVPKQILDKHWIPLVFRKFVSFLYASYEKNICKKLDAIVSVTPIICSRFKAFHLRVEMIANYPDLNEFDFSDATKKRDPKALCYVGGLFPTRGIKELVQAMALVDGVLHLAGTFSTPAFEAEIKGLLGWQKVKYYGHVSREQVSDILRHSSIGVVTLLPTASYLEAYPIKLFEYMAAGLPVLASDFPLWRDLVEKYSCTTFVDPASPKDIALKINELLTSENAEEMGNRGKNAVMHDLNWQTEATKLIRLYKHLIH